MGGGKRRKCRNGGVKMTDKNYKRLIKLLDKVIKILGKENVKYHKDDFGNTKVWVYKAYKEIKCNKIYWVEENA